MGIPPKKKRPTLNINSNYSLPKTAFEKPNNKFFENMTNKNKEATFHMMRNMKNMKKRFLYSWIFMEIMGKKEKDRANMK